MLFSSHNLPEKIKIFQLFLGLLMPSILMAEQKPCQIFISSSMPDTAIQEYYNKIKSQPESRIVMRGLIEGSMIKTKAYIERLKVVVDIDPPAFEDFDIKVVPTILIQEGEGHYYKHTGHVPVSYVLEKIQESKK
jgi:type-F conjugative transfer system pilin assembly protein TrbC